MKLNKKGEGGFMEAMAAVMVVTIALTSFMGLLAYSELPTTEKSVEIDTTFLNSLKIDDGVIVGDIHDELQYIADTNGIETITVNVKIVGNIALSTFTDTYGENRTTDVVSRTGTIYLDADDGRTFIASYEVICWI